MKISGICGDCGKYYQGNDCPHCKDMSTGNTFHVIPDIEPHFNRGLGEYVKSRSDYRTFLKDKGMVEIGNEKKYVDPETVRNNKEKAQEMAIHSLRPEAYKMLASFEGANKWN